MERVSESVEAFQHWLDWLSSSQVHGQPSFALITCSDVCLIDFWDMHASNSIDSLRNILVRRSFEQAGFAISDVPSRFIYCNLKLAKICETPGDLNLQLSLLRSEEMLFRVSLRIYVHIPSIQAGYSQIQRRWSGVLNLSHTYFIRQIRFANPEVRVGYIIYDQSTLIVGILYSRCAFFGITNPSY